MTKRNREIRHAKEMYKHESIKVEELKDMYEQLGKEAQAEFLRLFGGDEELTVSESKKRVSRSELYDYKEQRRKFEEWLLVEKERFDDLKDTDLNKAKSQIINKANNKPMTHSTRKQDVLLDNIEMKLTSTTHSVNDELTVYLNNRAELEVMRQSGIIGSGITPQAVLQNIVVREFHGDDFSSKLWKHKEILIEELDRILTQQMKSGINPREAARQLREKVEATKYDSERLLRTEASRVQADVQIVSAKDSGYDKVEFISTEDDSVCDICAGLHDRVFTLKEAQGVIPAHPNCRCSFSAYID